MDAPNIGLVFDLKLRGSGKMGLREKVRNDEKKVFPMAERKLSGIEPSRAHARADE